MIIYSFIRNEDISPIDILRILAYVDLSARAEAVGMVLELVEEAGRRGYTINDIKHVLADLASRLEARRDEIAMDDPIFMSVEEMVMKIGKRAGGGSR